MAPANLTDILNVLPPKWIATRNLPTAFLLGLIAGSRLGPVVQKPAEALLASLTDPAIPPSVPAQMAEEIANVLKSGLDGDTWGGA